MQDKNNIFDQLKKEEEKAITASRKAVIIQPGAIGDCILTLSLVRFLKTNLNIGSVDMIGHTSYIDYFVGRSNIDSIKSIDSIPLHKLFVDHAKFDIEDNDPMLYTFANYGWIITFLNDPDNNFEQNLIYLANCTHPAEVTAIKMKPEEDYNNHVSNFYIEEYLKNAFIENISPNIQTDTTLLTTTESDIKTGKEILNNQTGISENIVIIAPGSGGKEKCWHIRNFVKLSQILKSENYNPVFILGPAEQERLAVTDMDNSNNAAPILTDLSLSQVLAVISNAKHFIGNDSGLSHLSAALSTPTTTIFGPTNPINYKPIGPNVKIFKFDDKDFNSFSPQNIEKILQTLEK